MQTKKTQKSNNKNIITKTLKNNTIQKYYSVNNKANNFNVVNSKASSKTHLQKLNTTTMQSYNAFFTSVCKAANVNSANFNNTVKSYVSIKVACKTVKSLNLQFYCNVNKYFIYINTQQQFTKQLLQFILNTNIFNAKQHNICILQTQQTAVYIYNCTVQQVQQVSNLILQLSKF